MIRPPAIGERWVALFLLALVLFSPPLLSVFGQHQLLAIPFIYVYLFLAWGVVIALAALAVESGPPEAAGERSPGTDDDATGGGD
jgi:hypothetical protein